jgi:copper homeostasis protein
MPVIIEVPVFNIRSAEQAWQGGAHRIELCDNPAEGGTTPSYGVIEQVVHMVKTDVFVMIRPRGGDFTYSQAEFRAMEKDIEICRQMGVQGVVLGVLTREGSLDIERCRDLIARARPMQVTLHRAFDVTRNRAEALEDAIGAGFNRILTAGGKPEAHQGLEQIAALVHQAGNRIIIMAGSGIHEDNARLVAEKARVREIHCSARRWFPQSLAGGVHFNQPLPADGGWFEVDQNRLLKIRTALNQIG